MFNLSYSKHKNRLLLSLIGVSLFSGFSGLTANAALSPELILHGNYGGGSSGGGVVHEIKYDATNNVYYVTRNNTGIMSKVSGEAWATQDMKDSKENLAQTINQRKELLTDETDARVSADAAIQEKLDGFNILLFDDDSHDSITLSGSKGSTISNVLVDETNSSSLANGNLLFQLDELISNEKANRESTMSDLVSNRKEQDQKLSDRIGTIPFLEKTYYVDSENSASDNLAVLDNKIKENSDTLSNNIQDRKTLIDAETNAQNAADQKLWDALGKIDDSKVNYISSSNSAATNLETLDNQLGLIRNNINGLGNTRDDAVNAEAKARKNSDQLLSNQIGNISSDAKVNYIHSDNDVISNLKELDSAIFDNNNLLEAEINERKNAISNLNQNANGRLDYMSKEIVATGAKVAAISSLKYGTYTKGQKTSFSVGFGSYRNKSVGAFGIKYYFNKDWAVNTAITTGPKNMANFGIATRIRMETPALKELRNIKNELIQVTEDNDLLLKEIEQLKANGGYK